MGMVYRKLADLVENPDNPRKSTPEGIKELAKSIADNPDFFEARPILLSDRTGVLMIIGGEQRSKAARSLGMEEVPTILFSGISEEREREIMILDNTHRGEWDYEALNHSWDKDKLESWGVDGYYLGEFEKKMTDEEFEKKFNAITDKDAFYPIIPQYDEKHEIFIIVSDSEQQSNHLRELLNMQKMKSYKSDKVIKSNVISIDDAIRAIKNCNSELQESGQGPV